MNKRLEHALNCEVQDQVPFLPAIFEHKAWFVGETPSRVARDAHLLTTALLAEYERVQPDALTIGVDVYNVEAEAIGCSVIYYEGDDNSVPAIGSEGAVFQGSEDVTSLKMPDPRKDGRMPLNLEVARNIVKVLGKEVPIRGAVSGPFSLAAHLAGPENFFMLTVTQPDLVNNLLHFASEVIKRYGKAFVELGCGVVIFDSVFPRAGCAACAVDYRGKHDEVTRCLSGNRGEQYPVRHKGRCEGVLEQMFDGPSRIPAKH
ncbi:MAG: Uroporphyrinogen decarboxylase [Bacteroidetes bacterium]|nr:Uroporphyrinogen decarboxylase [Bacteroidota bacterium]